MLELKLRTPKDVALPPELAPVITMLPTAVIGLEDAKLACAYALKFATVLPVTLSQ